MTLQEKIISLFRWYADGITPQEIIVIDWSILQYHRLDMIYYEYCAQQGIAIPRKMQERKLGIASKVLKHVEVSHRCAELLKRENIDFVFLKGISLLDSVYQKPWHRYFNDVDLFVDEKAINNVAQIFLNQGYQYGYYCHGKILPASRAEIRYQRLFTHELYNLTKRDQDGFVSNIDINSLFSWVGNSDRDSILRLSDISAHTFSSNGLPCLDNIANLVHLCSHLYNEAVFFLQNPNFSGGDPCELLLNRVFDIALLVKQMSNIDFQSAVEFAMESNCIKKLAFAFAIVDAVFCSDYKGSNKALSQYTTEPNIYYSKTYKKMTWPISIRERIFDLGKKESISRCLFK